MLLHELDVACLRDNSPSLGFGRRKWRCVHCEQPFSRGTGRWFQGLTRPALDRELREVGACAGMTLRADPLDTDAEVQADIMELRQILKAGNRASFCFCSRDCYWTWSCLRGVLGD